METIKRIAAFVSIQFAPFLLIAIPTPATAQQETVDSLVQVVRRLEFEMRRLVDIAEGGDAGEAAPVTIPDQRYRTTSGIGERPFVFNRGGTAVGGYIDLEFTADLDTDRSTFRQHRLIPFIFAEINERIHFGMEVEFEDGGPDAPNGDGEVKVEFAALDVAASEWLNLRAGAVLVPLGKFNLVHDSPVNDLTDRPLVDRLVIPTTFTEAGFGAFGTLYPSEETVVTYEFYLVNGLDAGLVEYSASISPGTSSMVAELDVRSARGSLKRDNNNSRAFTGRLGLSPFLGLEVGLSGYTARYAASGSGRFSIFALDGIYQRGRLELVGELARSALSVDPAGETESARQAFDLAASAAGLAGPAADAAFQSAFPNTSYPDGQLGYFLQLNYHFGQDLLNAFPQSTFTGTVRWGRVDQNRAAMGDHRERLTVGVNLRLVEQTVIKVAHQWNWSTPAGSTSRGPAANRLVASVASYF